MQSCSLTNYFNVLLVLITESHGFLCVNLHTVMLSVPKPLPKHRAVLQSVCGGAVLEDVVIETGQFLSRILGAPPPWTLVLHWKQLRAQVVEPQHVGARVVAAPLVSLEMKQKQEISTTAKHWGKKVR